MTARPPAMRRRGCIRWVARVAHCDTSTAPSSIGTNAMPAWTAPKNWTEVRKQAQREGHAADRVDPRTPEARNQKPEGERQERERAGDCRCRLVAHAWVGPALRHLAHASTVPIAVAT